MIKGLVCFVRLSNHYNSYCPDVQEQKEENMLKEMLLRTVMTPIY